MTEQTLYDPIGDVLREDVQRELAVKLSDFERLAIAEAKAIAEAELEQLQQRFAEVKREWARRFEDVARRIGAMSTELRSREQVRLVLCYERWKAGQVEVVRRDLDPRDPSSVIERRAASLAESQKALPVAPPAGPVEPAPPEPVAEPKRKARRA